MNNPFHSKSSESERVPVSNSFERLEADESRKKLREFVLEKLKKIGVIWQEKNILIIDVERFKKIGIKEIFGKFDEASYLKFADFAKLGRREVLGLAFYEEKAVSKQDWEAGKKVAKPIFYNPDTLEEALDPDWIKEQDFHLGLWEIMDAKSITNNNYPGMFDEMSIAEVTISALIFNKNFGNGYRDEKGRLMVKDGKTEEYRPISYNWFTDIGFSGGRVEIGGRKLQRGISSTKAYLEKFAPNLFESEILRRDDFKTANLGGSKERRKERFGVSSDGSLMINGVKHYLGKKFYGKPIIIYEIAPGLGGIATVDSTGNQTLTHTFTLIGLDNPDVSLLSHGVKKTEQSGKEYGYAGAFLTKVEDFNFREVNKRKPNETVKQYLDRVKALENFQIILKYSRLLELRAGINLAKLPLDEQSRLTELFNEISEDEREKIIDFAAACGLMGLRSLISAKGDARQIRDILTMARTLGPILAREVFNKYGEILDAAHKSSEKLSQEFFRSGLKMGEEQKGLLEKDLERRGKSLIVDFAKDIERLKASQRYVKLKEVIGRLDETRQDMAIFASLFKQLRAEHVLDFKDIQGLTMESAPPSRIQDYLPAMRAIISRNWTNQKPEVAEAILKGFDKVTRPDNENSKFYILRRDGHIISFGRFDKRPDGSLYAGSLNVAPEARGAILGDAFFSEVINREAAVGKNTVVADFFPEVAAGMMYIERQGFVITGVEEMTIMDNRGRRQNVKRFKIRRNDLENAGYEARKMKAEEIVNRFKANKLPPGLEVMPIMEAVVKDKKDLERMYQDMLEASRDAESRGLVATRYFKIPNDLSHRYLVFERSLVESAESIAA